MNGYYDCIFNNGHALSSVFIGSDGGVVIDVAQIAKDARKIFNTLDNSKNVKSYSVFITHGHKDHIRGLKKLLEYCEEANIKLQTVYSDARNIKCSFLNHLIEDTMVNMWRRKNPYNGIEITADKIDKYFSSDYVELSNEEIEAIRSNSRFLSENPNETHMPKEEQYILKMYLLDMKPSEAFKAYYNDGNKKNKISSTEFIYQAAKWIEWKSGKEHSMERFVTFPYDRRKKLYGEAHTMHGIEVTSYIINSEYVSTDVENIGPLYLVNNKMTGTKTVILGDMPKRMQEDFYERLCKDKDLKEKFKDIDCVQIAHHGSENNYCKELLEELNPTFAVIPETINCEYNEKEQKLPSPMVMSSLRKLSFPTLVTGDFGDIKYYKEDGVLHVKPQKVLEIFKTVAESYKDDGVRNNTSERLEKICNEDFIFLNDKDSKKGLTKIFSNFTKLLENDKESALLKELKEELETIKQIEQKGEEISRNKEKSVLDVLVKEIKNLNRIFNRFDKNKELELKLKETKKSISENSENQKELERTYEQKLKIYEERLKCSNLEDEIIYKQSKER